MSRDQWTLWMDESGAGTDGPDVVAGLLTHADAADLLEAFRCAVQRDLPWVPWPLHATEFNHAEMHAVWLHQHAQADFTPTGLLAGRDAAVQQFLDAIGDDASSRKQMIKLRPSKATGRPPKGWFDEIHRLKLPPVARRVAAELHADAAKALAESVRALLLELKKLGLGTPLFAAHGETVVVTRVSRALNPSLLSPLDKKSGWTRMGAEVVARGCDWLAASHPRGSQPTPSQHEATLLPHPLQRHQAEPAYIAQAAPILLAGNPTSTAAPPIRLAPDRAGPAVASVQVQPTVISDFDRNSPPGHVVADILSNRARSSFVNPRATLSQLEQELGRIGVPAGSTLPIAAAAGESSVRLRDARATGSYPPPSPSLRPWAEEQAVALLRAGTRGWRVV